MLVALLAILRCGMVPIFIEHMSGPRDLNKCCDMLPPRALLADFQGHLRSFLSRPLRRIPVRLGTGEGPWLPGHEDPDEPAGRAAENSAAPEMTQVDRYAPALVRFYVADGQEPRATVHTHYFLQRQVLKHRKAARLEPGERDLCSSFALMLSNLLSGVTTILPDFQGRRNRMPGIGPIRRQIRLLQPNRATGSRLLGESLLRIQDGLLNFHSVILRDPDAPLNLIRQLQQKMPQTRVITMYQVPEVDPVAMLNASSITDGQIKSVMAGKGLCLGKPPKSLQVRILDTSGSLRGPDIDPEEFRERCNPPLIPGEMVMRGRHVMAGYLHGRGDAQRKLRMHGKIWHRTGDYGYQDAEGFLWLLGRQSVETLEGVERDQRGTFYPLAVESAAREALSVRQALAIVLKGRRLLLIEPAWDPDADAGEHGSLPQLRQKAREELTALLGWAELDEIHCLGHLPREIPRSRRDRVRLVKELLTGNR
jgi:acyl-CoA synthetase (AMP-forming)/AMP-acid ligase II